MTDNEKLCLTAESLVKDGNNLVAHIRENRISPSTLGADAGFLAREFEKLRVSIMRKHEENQRNGANPDS